MIDSNHSQRASDSVGVDRPVIFVDADNTLWDTDKVFAEAQLELLHAVENACEAKAQTPDRLDFIRSIDQKLAARHHLGLRYPPRLLVIALSQMLQGIPVKDAAKNAWTGLKNNYSLSTQAAEKVEKQYFDNLDRIPSLLPGVKTGLSELHVSSFKILILTEGHKERISRSAQAHGLMPFVDRVIEAKKDSRFFERVLRLVGSPKIAVMIGDQVTKDILPASQAGLRTIYIPGNFKPSWEDGTPNSLIDFQVHSFAEVPTVVRRICRMC